MYAMHRLRDVGAVRRLIPVACEHVLQHRCPHLHCMCLRMLVLFGVLQLCLWQSQVFMLMAYGCLCALLLLDAMLDECVPPALDRTRSTLPLPELAIPHSPHAWPPPPHILTWLVGSLAGCWFPLPSCPRCTPLCRQYARFASARSASLRLLTGRHASTRRPHRGEAAAPPHRTVRSRPVEHAPRETSRERGDALEIRAGGTTHASLRAGDGAATSAASVHFTAR